MELSEGDKITIEARIFSGGSKYHQPYYTIEAELFVEVVEGGFVKTLCTQEFLETETGKRYGHQIDFLKLPEDNLSEHKRVESIKDITKNG